MTLSFEEKENLTDKYYEKGVRDIADPSKPEALKMDGAKLATDIIDLFNWANGREACCEGRSVIVSWRGPCSKEDPAGSSNQVG